MKVQFKDLGVDMQVKSRGIELQISDPSGKQVGDLIVTQTKIIWCKGRTRRENGKKLSWNKFAEVMKEKGS
jgi:hypothetical protein